VNGRLIYVMKSIWLEPSNRGQRFRRVLMFFGWQLWKRFYASVCTAAGFSFSLSVRTL
jgi:hypothetical protein